ncbi:MAG: hypothetical protein AMJ68_00600 [Acidithiobacillales bacterium SG8_45]|nr:MAG: hypothetical protein AMJ68_00600 [Acidithiobacillales bacterium SG8_45]
MQTLKTFLIWCTAINGSLLTLWTIAFLFAPELTYKTQSKWIPIARENFNLAMYSFLGLFKILFLIFNVVPLLALLIIG